MNPDYETGLTRFTTDERSHFPFLDEEMHMADIPLDRLEQAAEYEVTLAYNLGDDSYARIANTSVQFKEHIRDGILKYRAMRGRQ